MFWRSRSAIRIVEARSGKGGRWRWVGLDAHGQVRVVPTVPQGWSRPPEAIADGLAAFPRAYVRIRAERKDDES